MLLWGGLRHGGSFQNHNLSMELKLKTLVDVLRHATEHWVGDGFPVRTVFSYDQLGQELSPFLLLDYVGPHEFETSARPRGVGPHPHRGFETVTIVYDGEVAHADSAGCGGIIGPGDVQWMTAGSGILHQEFHSPRFTKTGGVFRVAQLWINLPADRKLTAPRYQSIKAETMPVVELEGGAGHARIIAGSFGGQMGPAKTFTGACREGLTHILIWSRTASGSLTPSHRIIVPSL